MMIRKPVRSSADREEHKTPLEVDAPQSGYLDKRDRSFSFNPSDCFAEIVTRFIPLYSTIKVINEGDGVAMRTLGWEATLIAGYTAIAGIGYGAYKGIEAIFS